MLVKKFRQDGLEKFCVKIPSKAWGKGVGSGGEEEGMVGKTWDAAGTNDEVVDVGVDDPDEINGEVGDAVAWGSGSLFHLDWLETNPCHEGGGEPRDDVCTRLVEKPA